jgi:hypothetical protein
MSDILISEENAYFEPLKKPGYNLYFNTISDDTQDKKYKIIYKNDKNVSDVLPISNSVIFNNIYSHEINENDIPLVEYYNLLIENKSLPLEDNQLKLTSQIEAVQTQPPLLTSSQNNSSLQLSTSPLSFTNSTNRTDDTNQRQPLYIQDEHNIQDEPNIQGEPNIQDEPKKNIKEKIKESLKKVWGAFTGIFQNKSIEKINIILGVKNTPIENISAEYYSRYPPEYNGPFFKIHAIDKSKENLVEIDDATCIRLIATKWNTYIITTIESSKSFKPFKKTQQEFKDILDRFLDDDYYRNQYWRFLSNNIDSYNYDFTKSTIADLNYFDKYREYNLDLYHLGGDDINPKYLEHVNKYGYPLYRAYSKHIEIMNGEISKSPIILKGGFLQNIINPTQSLSSSITNKYAWDYNSGEITRFNGYYDMSYDRIKINIFEYNDNKNMNIKFSIFSKGDIKTIDNLTTIIILKTSDNKIDPIIVTSKEAFLQENEDKLENKIIAKISTTADVDNNTYILFDVDIIRNIKDAKIYKEEDKNKYDFLKLNNDLKKIIEYYKAIVNLPYFRTYGNIEKQLILFKEVYNNSENLSQQIETLITIYKEELGLRISICDNILVSSSIDNNIKKNIKKYKDLLFYTQQHIDNHPDKMKYIERIHKCIPLLIDRVRYYGENFIY